MKVEKINASTANFAFKEVKGKRGVKFKSVCAREDGTGSSIEVEHNGHDHLNIDFRRLYALQSGKIGNRREMLWTLDSKLSVQLATILIYLVDNHMYDSAENPYSSVAAHKEKIGFGPNWFKEDLESSLERTERRKDRSHLFGLMKRCIETCEDAGFIQFLMMNLAGWAERSGDEFAVQQAEKALAQLGMIDKTELN